MYTQSLGGRYTLGWTKTSVPPWRGPHRANCILPHPLNPLTVLIEVTHVKGETLVVWEPILTTEVFFNSILTTRETDLKEACDGN